jgi:ryanodine receptor 2
VPLEDLQGVLSLRFTQTNPAAGEERPKSDMPSGLIPGNKQSIVLFLERVYGIETQELFYKLLEDAFLPDLRAATMLDRVSRKPCSQLIIWGLQMTVLPLLCNISGMISYFMIMEILQFLFLTCT